MTTTTWSAHVWTAPLTPGWLRCRRWRARPARVPGRTGSGPRNRRRVWNRSGRRGRRGGSSWQCPSSSFGGDHEVDTGIGVITPRRCEVVPGVADPAIERPGGSDLVRDALWHIECAVHTRQIEVVDPDGVLLAHGAHQEGAAAIGDPDARSGVEIAVLIGGLEGPGSRIPVPACGEDGDGGHDRGEGDPPTAARRVLLLISRGSRRLGRQITFNRHSPGGDASSHTVAYVRLRVISRRVATSRLSRFFTSGFSTHGGSEPRKGEEVIGFHTIGDGGDEPRAVRPGLGDHL